MKISITKLKWLSLAPQNDVPLVSMGSLSEPLVPFNHRANKHLVQRTSMLPILPTYRSSAAGYSPTAFLKFFRRTYAQQLGPVPPRNHFKIWPFVLITATGTYCYTYLVKSRMNEETQQQKNKRRRLQKNASSGSSPNH